MGSRSAALALTGSLLFSSCLAAPAFAYPPDYGPFMPGRELPKFPLADCPVLATEGPNVVMGPRVIVYGSERTSGPRLRTIAADYFEGVEVEMLDGIGNSLVGSTWVSRFPPHGRPENAWCGDLNGDRRIDFVLPIESKGNGLGALFHDLVIALSSPSSYRIWVVSSMQPGPEDIVKLSTGAPAIITATYVHNDGTTEATRHSYWVYNLLRVSGDRLVLANDRDPRFPKWIWYTWGPNHKPVASLSNSEKHRLWNLEPPEVPLFREATAR